MNFTNRMLRRFFLTAALLLLPCSWAGAAPNQETGITVNQNPLQEEIQYLTPSQLAEEENLLAILWVQRSAEFRGLSYQAYNLATMEVDKAVALRQESRARQKKARSRTTLPIANQQKTNSRFDDEKMSATPETLRPLAVVLDIDDTIVCHAPLEVYYMEHPEAKANYKAWQAWIAQHNELLPGAKDFLKHADSRGVNIFYVTGRGAQDRDVTLAFLRNAGLPLPNTTHLRMNDKSGSKMNHFTALAQKYNIVCYIGDNAADFPIGAVRDENKSRNAKVDANRKSFGTKFILLPNPMYGDWEYNLAKKYRSLPSEQRIALRKAALEPFTCAKENPPKP